ncbi:MAG: GntR family transcriptional regulator [Pseudomonadota bacterium]
MSQTGFKIDEAGLTLDRSRQTLADLTADKLREFILLEKLPAGAPIVERDIAAALGISRTPLRAALSILEQEKLVDYSVTRRPRVANPSLEDISQNTVVMGTLEALAGELACANASDQEITKALALIDQMERDSNRIAALDFFRVDMEMHETIVRASRNDALIDTHRQYNARLWRARFLSSRRNAGRDQTLAEHRRIGDALRLRDGKATADAMRIHMSSAITNITAALAEQTDTPAAE